ncbi:helix-turn-helix domain-containing protein [Longitalea luteola]|uniref:helix-turn-helix domain-containing protein n=1 Tax=Longitalea luteola TaxID=2812563 RepID=UPI001A97BDF1|nr:helix-turn-helix transcriptional regulator [Longitalea luteola]
MTIQEKEILKMKFGMAVMKRIEENKLIAKANKQKGKLDNVTIDSLRKLEASSGIPYASINQIVNGRKNPSFTTISALLEGLDLKLDEFFTGYYYKISDMELEKRLKSKKGK